MENPLAEAFPAGEHLAEELVARGWTQAEFAEILGRPAQFVSEIISGKKEITRESAAQIGAALSTSAEFWLKLQDAYYLWKQSKDHDTQAELSDVRLRARLNELAPMAVLRKRRIVTSTTTEGQVAEVKRLFKLKDIMDEPELAVAARRTNTDAPLTPTQKAWLACVELELTASTTNYSEDGLTQLAKRLSRIVREPESFATLPKLFRKVGVRLVYVEAFPSSKISGATFLLDTGPVIALSGRGHRLDVVLFTLLHEVAHLVRGDVNATNRSIVDEDTGHTLGNETLADELAASWRFPYPLPDVPVRITQEWIDDVAGAMGIHPIVIVGCLQKMNALPWRTLLAKGAPTVTTQLSSW
jgi:HTH-type transcriptional regulator/antitoxin HigA